MSNWACGAHLGDCLFTLSYLLKRPEQHTLYVLPEFVQELRSFVHHSNVQVEDCTTLPADVEDTWMANARHEGCGIFFQNQVDIMGFIHGYFNCFKMAWGTREEMLFEFPWLKPQAFKDLVLIINAQPMSGQCPDYSQEDLNRLALDLQLDGQRVIRVCGDQGEHNFSLLQIACLSAHAKLIIGGASGPFFATMNTAARDCHRVVLLDPMRLDYGPNVGPFYHSRNCTEARQILREQKYLRYL